MCDWPAPEPGSCSSRMPPCPSPCASLYPCPTPSTIIPCSEPVPDIRRPRVTCKAYFPSVEPIKSVRFTPATGPYSFAEWTNLTYHPMVRGGVRYCGVEKLVPFGPPPGPPTLCRPSPIRPSDHPGMIVYSSP